MASQYSGSPVGVFSVLAGGTFGVANNQQVIAAPAAGLAIYLQAISINAVLGAGVNAAGSFHPAGGPNVAVIIISGAQSQQHTFPGGFKLATATALQVDVAINNVNIVVAYAVGPDV